MTTEQAAPAINPWQVAQRQFDMAAELLNLDQGLRLVLREPRRELTVHFPVKMDDGVRAGLHGLPRAAQPRPRPGQGRHPLPPGRHARRGQGAGHVDDLEVRRGGHSLTAAPRAASSSIPSSCRERELERLTRRYHDRDRRPHRPRAATSPRRTSTPMRRSWPGSWTPTRCTSGYTVPGVVTGKPIALGGIRGPQRGHRRAAWSSCIEEAARAAGHARSTAHASRSRASATRARSPPHSLAEARREGRRRQRLAGRHLSTRRASTSTRSSRCTGRSTASVAGFPGAQDDHQRGAARARRATS